MNCDGSQGISSESYELSFGISYDVKSATNSSVELSEWIQRYNRAIDHMLGERDDPF